VYSTRETARHLIRPRLSTPYHQARTSASENADKSLSRSRGHARLNEQEDRPGPGQPRAPDSTQTISAGGITVGSLRGVRIGPAPLGMRTPPSRGLMVRVARRFWRSDAKPSSSTSADRADEKQQEDYQGSDDRDQVSARVPSTTGRSSTGVPAGVAILTGRRSAFQIMLAKLGARKRPAGAAPLRNVRTRSRPGSAGGAWPDDPSREGARSWSRRP